MPSSLSQTLHVCKGLANPALQPQAIINTHWKLNGASIRRLFSLTDPGIVAMLEQQVCVHECVCMCVCVCVCACGCVCVLVFARAYLWVAPRPLLMCFPTLDSMQPANHPPSP